SAASIGVHYRPSSAASMLTVRGSRISALANTSADSAAIQLFNVSGGAGAQLLVEDSEFETVARGVQLKNYGHAFDVTVDRSLFTGVSAEAIVLSGPGTGDVRNSTISAAATGVALASPSSGAGTYDLTLDGVTIAGSSTSVAVGSGLGTVSARNSILADASSAACTGTLDSLGHNLIEGSCTVAGDTTGNVTGVDPMLDALADNGGFTRTRALLAGSAAIDAGDAANCPSRDQRDYARPADGDGNMDARCDIGAFEKDAVAAPSNTAPVAGDDTAFVDEDDDLIMGAASLLVNDVDAESDPLLISDATGTTGQGAHYACDDSSCSYNPPDDFFGSDSFDYEICDDGTPALCDTATVSVTVNPVNDAPSFLPGPAQVFAGGSSGAQSSNGWASSIELGPNESGQSVQAFELALQADPDGVVAGLPSIDAAGDLAFTLSGASGEASFEVLLRDDGGTANGGIDLSAAALLSVAVGTAADVSVSIQQCSEQAAPGELHAYAMRIENNGPDNALDVVLDAPLPAGASIDSIGNGDCMAGGGSVSCHIAQLAAGAGVAVPVVLLMPGGGPATLDLSATVGAASDDPIAGNNSASSMVMLVPGLILDTGFESCDGLAD
ncbi:MAG: cadherin-like domain-containing protein, partial [Xanthomonadales bacterium]|nr:cadherin-like domain-containing protein [Xanthomonadales bacterium]